MRSKQFQFQTNQPYHPLSTLDFSLGSFRVGVWLICLTIILLFFFSSLPAQAAECRLINILTDKSQVGPGESMQINVTAQKECIGKTARIHICDDLSCHEIASQTFSSRKVSGQDAINPIVINIVPTDFLNKNTTAWVQATVPFNTVKSRSISINATPEIEGPNNGLPNNIKQNTNTNSPTNALSNFPGEDLEAGDVIKIIVGLSCWLTRVAFTLTAIFIILAGFQFMTAQGNPQKYTKAVENFQTVLWGILVIYGVYVIIATVANAVGITDFSFIPLVC